MEKKITQISDEGVRYRLCLQSKVVFFYSPSTYLILSLFNRSINVHLIHCFTTGSWKQECEFLSLKIFKSTKRNITLLELLIFQSK